MLEKISAAEITRRWDIDKSKISRALKKGEISGEKGPNGRGYSIEISEAERWIKTLRQTNRANFEYKKSSSSDELATLRAEITAQERVIAELRHQKDDWKNYADSLLDKILESKLSNTQ